MHHYFIEWKQTERSIGIRNILPSPPLDAYCRLETSAKYQSHGRSSYFIHRSLGKFEEILEVDASVRYEFYRLPYFISTTSMRINNRIDCIALRNAEIVFKREQVTHAAWYDVVRDSIIVYNVSTMPDLTDLLMEEDVPWITFFNMETGIGFCGIQLSYSNAGLESKPRLLNPYMYIHWWTMDLLGSCSFFEFSVFQYAADDTCHGRQLLL